jgi:hypothetical protein
MDSFSVQAIYSTIPITKLLNTYYIQIYVQTVFYLVKKNNIKIRVSMLCESICVYVYIKKK